LNHRPRKRFGQNFLIDTNIIEKIIHSIRPHPDDHLVEIGPGLGALSAPLLEYIKRLDVIELDRDIIPELEKLDRNKLVIHNIDVLNFDFSQFQQDNFDNEQLRIFGNLPYNISTAVLFHLIEHRKVIQDMHFMLQKEVVERIAADKNSSNYGRLSVMLQLHCEVAPLFEVPPNFFRPAPKVDSAVIRLTPRRQSLIDDDDTHGFEDLVRQAFSQRRKTIKNNLKGFCTVAQLEAADINAGARPQELSVSDYIKLYQQLNKE
jgi:16S rRNA (adenine1518-N6/adenine1519-N6)-dimethyltransferase